MAPTGRGVSAPGLDPQEDPMKRLTALLLLAMFSIATLSACNTVQGVGKDVQKAGEAVEDAGRN
jgi:entericidin A